MKARRNTVWPSCFCTAFLSTFLGCRENAYCEQGRFLDQRQPSGVFLSYSNRENALLSPDKLDRLFNVWMQALVDGAAMGGALELDAVGLADLVGNVDSDRQPCNAADWG